MSIKNFIDYFHVLLFIGFYSFLHFFLLTLLSLIGKTKVAAVNIRMRNRFILIIAVVIIALTL